MSHHRYRGRHSGPAGVNAGLGEVEAERNVGCVIRGPLRGTQAAASAVLLLPCVRGWHAGMAHQQQAPCTLPRPAMRLQGEPRCRRHLAEETACMEGAPGAPGSGGGR